LRALRETTEIGRGYGLDGSPQMLANAKSYTDDDQIGFVRGDFDELPFQTGSIDHVFSMEAFFYAADPHQTLTEIARVLRPGGTFYCGVNFFEESVHTHKWQDNVDIEMTLWNSEEYRDAFREAGLFVAEQEMIPDTETEIPPESEFPTEDWESRDVMRERFREHGTLLTVGVAPA
jgi:ubiquinone/menaquinone biosynthesis C-methylase UbiE